VEKLYPGPELCEITKTQWPDGFASDLMHPGYEVRHTMALYWYAVIAGEDAREDIMGPVADSAGISVPERTFTGSLVRKQISPSLKSAISVIPNPFNSIATITFENAGRSARLAVYDIDGRVVKRFVGINQKQVEWNASALPKGIYLLKIVTNRQIFSKKVILLK
jgi:hypothetical protein